MSITSYPPFCIDPAANADHGSWIDGWDTKARSRLLSRVAPARLLLVRSFVLVAVYYLLSLYYFGASFDLHCVNSLATPCDRISLLLPFY